MSSAAYRSPAVSVAVSRSAELLTPTESKERPAVISATLRPVTPITHTPHDASVSFSEIDPKFTRTPLDLLLGIICASVGVRYAGLQAPVASSDPLVVFVTEFGASSALSLNGFGTNPLMRHVESVYARFNKPSPYPPKQNEKPHAKGCGK